MKKSISMLYTSNSDEYYTPKILVDIIVPYIKNFTTIWCPFDTQNSEFCLMFKELGIEVIHSHIKTGQDFFDYFPNKNFDAIISNPPFSKKMEVYKRLDEIGKPWAMVASIMSLNYLTLGRYFGKNPELQLLIPDKRISYNGKGSSFISGYFCKNILPKQIVFTKINDDIYIPSRMHKDFEDKNDE